MSKTNASKKKTVNFFNSLKDINYIKKKFRTLVSTKAGIAKLIASLILVIVLFNVLKEYSFTSLAQRDEESIKDRAAQNDTSIELEKLAMKEVVEDIDVLGQIVYFEKINVSSKVQGRLEKLYIQEGKKVNKGDLLAEIERLPLELSLKQQMAELDISKRSYDLSKAKYENAIKSIEIKFKSIEKAKADLNDKLVTFNNMERTLKNKMVLYKAGGVSETELESVKAQHTTLHTRLMQARSDLEIQEVGFRDRDIEAEGLKVPKSEKEKVKIFQNINTKIEKAELDAAKSKIYQSEQAIESTRMMLRESYIRSPISGVVAVKSMEAGEMVKPESVIATVMNIFKVFMAVNINEKDSKRLKVGQELVFKVDAMGDETFKGKVDRITPLLDAKTRTIEVKALVENRNSRLLPGMFARGRIVTGKKAKGILVPSSALLKKVGDSAEVFIVKNSIVFKQVVKVGVESKLFVEILKGLSEGDVIVARGVNLVYPQMKIDKTVKVKEAQ